MATQITVWLDAEPPDRDTDAIGYLTALVEHLLGKVHALVEGITERITAMSDTISAQLDSLAASEETDIATIAAAITAIREQLAQATSGPAPDLTKIAQAQSDLHALATALTPPTGSAATQGAAATAPAQSAPTTTGTVGTETASTTGTLPALPLYTYSGTATPDAVTWRPADVETDEATPRPLYTFAADQPGGNPSGASADWDVYTGPTKAVAGATPTAADTGPVTAPAPGATPEAAPSAG